MSVLVAACLKLRFASINSKSQILLVKKPNNNKAVHFQHSDAHLQEIKREYTNSNLNNYNN